MSSYHVNPTTGNVGLCRAKKSCPFGTVEEHYSSRDEAQAAYEKVEASHARAKQAFVGNMQKVATALEARHGGYYVPRGLISSIQATEVGLWTRRYVQGLLHRVTGKMISDEELERRSRDAVASAPQIQLDSAFWASYYDAITHPISPTLSIGDHSSEQVGDEATARGLMELLQRHPAEDLARLAGEKSPFTKELTAQGFQLTGKGEENMVFLHLATDTVWKTSRYNKSNCENGEGVRNSLVGQATFPKLDTIRPARATGYFLGKRAVLAQEKVVASRPSRALTKQEWVLMQLSGHDDAHGANFHSTAKGEVAFDTLGTVWEDSLTYPLSNEIKLEN